MVFSNLLALMPRNNVAQREAGTRELLEALGRELQRQAA